MDDSDLTDTSIEEFDVDGNVVNSCDDSSNEYSYDSFCVSSGDEDDQKFRLSDIDDELDLSVIKPRGQRKSAIDARKRVKKIITQNPDYFDVGLSDDSSYASENDELSDSSSDSE